MSQHVRETLYHGTIAKIEHVDVRFGRGNKDFGKGFYMAVSKGQAIAMMHKKYREAVRRSRNHIPDNISEHLYEIKIDAEAAEKMNLKIFYGADMEWIDFILRCREQKESVHDYDMVIGPTADDDTLLCLKAYWDGLYGVVGSYDAKRILLNNLEPENLGVQYYIGKQEIADKLITSITEIGWR